MTDCVTYPRLEKAGRLGNQLFQVAATVGVASELGARPSLPAGWSYRQWFSCPDEWFEPSSGTVQNIEAWRGLAHIDPAARMYLQDFGLFRDVADEIREAFRPSKLAGRFFGDLDDSGDRIEPWLEDIQEDAIALHVRRGDLLTQQQGFQPVLPASYYHDAVRTFDGWEDRPVWCFSDDPSWCREAMPDIIGRPVKTMVTTDARPVGADYFRAAPMDWVDLQVMSWGNDHIMSNSTYAWWAVFLSQNPEPRYPATWFGPNLAHVDISLMVPAEPTWVKIEC